MCTCSIKTAIVGIGNMGSAHAQCIFEGKIEGMTLSEVCDINTERLNKFAQEHPGVDIYESFDEMLEKGNYKLQYKMSTNIKRHFVAE